MRTSRSVYIVITAVVAVCLPAELAAFLYGLWRHASLHVGKHNDPWGFLAGTALLTFGVTLILLAALLLLAEAENVNDRNAYRVVARSGRTEE